MEDENFLSKIANIASDTLFGSPAEAATGLLLYPKGTPPENVTPVNFAKDIPEFDKKLQDQKYKKRPDERYIGDIKNYFKQEPKSISDFQNFIAQEVENRINARDQLPKNDPRKKESDLGIVRSVYEDLDIPVIRKLGIQSIEDYMPKVLDALEIPPEEHEKMVNAYALDPKEKAAMLDREAGYATIGNAAFSNFPPNQFLKFPLQNYDPEGRFKDPGAMTKDAIYKKSMFPHKAGFAVPGTTSKSDYSPTTMVHIDPEYSSKYGRGKYHGAATTLHEGTHAISRINDPLKSHPTENPFLIGGLLSKKEDTDLFNEKLQAALGEPISKSDEVFNNIIKRKQSTVDDWKIEQPNPAGRYYQLLKKLGTFEHFNPVDIDGQQMYQPDYVYGKLLYPELFSEYPKKDEGIIDKIISTFKGSEEPPVKNISRNPASLEDTIPAVDPETGEFNPIPNNKFRRLNNKIEK
jgi:hypothetical protein